MASENGRLVSERRTGETMLRPGAVQPEGAYILMYIADRTTIKIDTAATAAQAQNLGLFHHGRGRTRRINSSSHSVWGLFKSDIHNLLPPIYQIQKTGPALEF